MQKITLGGIEATVEKKRIKNMYIRVCQPDGSVKITAPLRATNGEIRRLLESRAAWVEKQRRKLALHPAQTEPAYVTGESCFLWGERYRLMVIDGAKSDVHIDGQSIILRVREDSTATQRAEALARFYRDELMREIPPELEKYQRIVGVRAAEFRIKNMKSRWGTCNTREKRIWLNLCLAKMPPECLTYVIVHELVHLLERSHNAVFKAYMDRFYPNWRLVKARLNGKMGGDDGE